MEPHDYGIQNGSLKLLAFQIGGNSSGKLPNWRWMEVASISEIRPLERTFPGGRAIPLLGKHHQWDQLFARVEPAKEEEPIMCGEWRRAVGSVKPMTKIFAIVIASSLTATAVEAQSARPEFDVSSVKPNKTNCCFSGGANNGQAGAKDSTLKALISLAYKAQEFQIVGGPGWIGSDRFDVEGGTEDKSADPDRLRLMLRSLLEDRFKLKLHMETREAPIYALVVTKDGPKIKLAADQTSPEVNGPSKPGAGPNHGAIKFGPGSMIGNAVNLSLFVRFLSQRLDRPIVDRTGLSGRYDFLLQWTPEVGEAKVDPGGNPLPVGDTTGPSIFSAIQEQLGLDWSRPRGRWTFW